MWSWNLQLIMYHFMAISERFVFLLWNVNNAMQSKSTDHCGICFSLFQQFIPCSIMTHSNMQIHNKIAWDINNFLEPAAQVKSMSNAHTETKGPFMLWTFPFSVSIKLYIFSIFDILDKKSVVNSDLYPFLKMNRACALVPNLLHGPYLLLLSLTMRLFLWDLSFHG